MVFCEICADRGIVMQGDVAVPCVCVARRTLLNRFKESKLPTYMANCTFERFNFKYYSSHCYDPDTELSYYDAARQTFNAAKNFVVSFTAKESPKGMIITGQVGSGKTYLACCIANALIKQGDPVLFLVVPDLLDKIRATYDQTRGAPEYSEQQIMETAREVPLLILDDLGAHNYTDWSRNKIYSILNYRLNYDLPTIVTTNISLEDMETFLGERTTSRLYQMCRAYQLFVETDIRLLIGGE